jgi:hypothetical protein
MTAALLALTLAELTFAPFAAGADAHQLESTVSRLEER